MDQITGVRFPTAAGILSSPPRAYLLMPTQLPIQRPDLKK